LLDAEPNAPKALPAGAGVPKAVVAGFAPNAEGVEGGAAPNAPKPLGRAGVEAAPKGLGAGVEVEGAAEEVEDEVEDWERANWCAWSRLLSAFWTAASAFCASACSGCGCRTSATFLDRG